METTTTTPNIGEQRKKTTAVKMEPLAAAADGGEMFSPSEKRGGKKGAAVGGGGEGSGSMRICQADKCTADLSDAKQYHRRHKVCEVHAKSQAVVVAGNRQRFCQQCSRFHELSEFDDTKRSCRRRLAGHNERRRKSACADSNSQGEGNSGSNSRLKGTTSTLTKEIACGQVDERGRIKINIQANAAYKHFHIR